MHAPAPPVGLHRYNTAGLQTPCLLTPADACLPLPQARVDCDLGESSGYVQVVDWGGQPDPTTQMDHWGYGLVVHSECSSELWARLGLAKGTLLCSVPLSREQAWQR